MSEWSTKKIEECAEILDHLRIPVNEEERSANPGTTPYFGANGIQGYINGWLFDEPLILMAEDGGYFEDFATRPIAYRISGKSWVNNHAHILRPKPNICFNYLFYSLEHKNITPFIKGGTRAKLNQKELREVEILVPTCKDRQKNISLILQTVDKAIEQTEALIEKYSLVKAGMMHDLFTRGLTPDGKLRPPREEAPDLYKETPIGRLPKGWDCSDLQDLLAPLPNNLRSGPFGSALLKSELVEDGIPFLGIDNIHVERFVPVYRRFVSDRKYRELIKYSVRPNDLVITIMGTVGRCAVVPETVETALSSKHLWTISLDQSAVIPALVCWQMNYAFWVKKWFRRETQGGIMDAIQSKTLKTLKLPVPPMPEQILIADRYTALSDQLRFEQERLEKLQLQKSGLMHDLLTGDVPVKIDDAEAAHV